MNKICSVEMNIQLSETEKKTYKKIDCWKLEKYRGKFLAFSQKIIFFVLIADRV